MKYLICIRKMIVFGLFCLLVLGCKQEQQTPESQPNPNTKPVTEQLSKTVSTSQLMTDYVNDPYNADLTYTETPFIVTGVITAIAPIESKHYIKQFEYHIVMDSGEINGTPTFVYCEFHRSQGFSLRHLKEGDTVKISGVVQTDSHRDAKGNTRHGGLRETIESVIKGEPKSYAGWLYYLSLLQLADEGKAYHVVMGECKLVK